MTEIKRTLEAERRIINAATAGPWREFDDEGQSYLCPPSTGAYLIDYGVDRSQQTRDATFIAHARTALPLRNAQVAKVLHECGEMEWWAQNCFDVGKDAEGKQWIRAAKAIRRAIEEAGA